MKLNGTQGNQKWNIFFSFSETASSNSVVAGGLTYWRLFTAAFLLRYDMLMFVAQCIVSFAISLERLILVCYPFNGSDWLSDRKRKWFHRVTIAAVVLIPVALFTGFILSVRPLLKQFCSASVKELQLRWVIWRECRIVWCLQNIAGEYSEHDGPLSVYHDVFETFLVVVIYPVCV